jgi:hypothetical protein
MAKSPSKGKPVSKATAHKPGGTPLKPLSVKAAKSLC